MEETTTTLISTNELEKLLFSITQQEPQICIRYRTLGQLWYPNFLKIVKIQDETTVLFRDDLRQKFISLSNLSSIAQFELDSRFRHFEPNCHYQVSGENCFYLDQ